MTQILSPDQARARASEIAGTDNFGPFGFEKGLERSLAAFASLPLTPDARVASNDRVVRDLVTRLRIEQWYTDNPNVAEQTLEGPVFVVGLPRTGTSATVAMLALDESFRFLRGWEGAAPVPPPVAEEEEADERLVAARAAAKDYEMSHVHLFDPDGPDEDLVHLAGIDMHAYHGSYPMPDDYIAWWMSEDFRSTYAYHERILKLLQSQRPPHLWLLKSPPHLFRLDAIVRQYPGARFVMTHRDPLKVMPSVSSLHCMLHERLCLPGTVDKASRGSRLLEFWAEGMRRGLAAREAIGEDRFVDVWNDDVVNRPLAVFEQVYEHLGMDLTASVRNRLEAYNSRNAPGSFGTHQYTIEEYGLSRETIRTAFKDYIERFEL